MAFKDAGLLVFFSPTTQDINQCHGESHQLDLRHLTKASGHCHCSNTKVQLASRAASASVKAPPCIAAEALLHWIPILKGNV